MVMGELIEYPTRQFEAILQELETDEEKELLYVCSARFIYWVIAAKEKWEAINKASYSERRRKARKEEWFKEYFGDSS